MSGIGHLGALLSGFKTWENYATTAAAAAHDSDTFVRMVWFSGSGTLNVTKKDGTAGVITAGGAGLFPGGFYAVTGGDAVDFVLLIN